MKFGLTSDLHYGFRENTQNKLKRFFQKVSEEKLDYLILAGDLACNSQHQFRRCLELAREELNCDIGIVRGNHDLWETIHKKDKRSGKRSLTEIYQYHEELCEDLEIDILTHEPGEWLTHDKKISLYGFDGWYEFPYPKTDKGLAANDKHNVPKNHEGCPTMPYLVDKAWKDFEKCLYAAQDEEADVKILVTHHNLYRELEYPDSVFGGNPKFLPEVRETFDILCCGHTHVYKKYMDGNLLILNSGSGYNDPKLLTFEV